MNLKQQFLLGPIILLLLAAFCAASAVVIQNVTVIDCTGSQPAPAMTVVFDEGVIRDIGKSGDVKTPEGAKVIDGSGKFLIPGLWDMHVHAALLGDDQWSRQVTIPLLLANGVVGFRDMGGNIDKVRQLAAEKGLSVVAAGNMLEGPGEPFEGITRVTTGEEARAAVDTLVKQKSDFIKVLSVIPRPAYFAIAEEAKKLGKSFVGHVQQEITAAEASDAGQKSIEHLDGILLASSSEEDAIRTAIAAALQKKDFAAFGAIRLRMLDTYDSKKAELLFAKFKKNGTWQVPTFSFLRTQTVLDQAQKLAEPNLKYVPKTILDGWNEALEKRRPSAADLPLAQRRFQKTMELLGALNKAGVNIMLGTDVDGETPFLVPGFALHDELKTFVDAGLTPMEALQAVTLRPAQFLGRRSSMGTLQKGKVADAVLLDGDPLADITNTRRIHSVILHGKVLTRSDLDTLLRVSAP